MLERATSIMWHRERTERVVPSKCGRREKIYFSGVWFPPGFGFSSALRLCFAAPAPSCAPPAWTRTAEPVTRIRFGEKHESSVWGKSWWRVWLMGVAGMEGPECYSGTDLLFVELLRRSDAVQQERCWMTPQGLQRFPTFLLPPPPPLPLLLLWLHGPPRPHREIGNRL